MRYVLPHFRKSPLFFCAAVATLAIGSGATTAIFSTVNATVLRPLPYPHPEQLVDVHTRLLDGRVTTGLLSALEINALNDTPDLVARAAGVTAQPSNLTLVLDDGSPLEMVAAGVTDGFFDVMASRTLADRSRTIARGVQSINSGKAGGSARSESPVRCTSPRS